jgi:uncharacterized repeat protein (TIGR01451 family)
LPSEPDISLTKTPSPTTYGSVGDVINYTLVATNDGNVPLSDVSISDPMFTTLTCEQPTALAVGATLTCTGTYTITQIDLNNFSVNNTATATGTYGSTPVSASASAKVTGAASPALTLDKKTTTANYDSVGDTISYTYDVTNSGNVRLAGPVTISDNKTTATCPNVNTVGNFDGFLDPGETITCTAVNYVVTQADLNAGSVTNIASASAGGTTSNTDTVTVNANQKPALTLDKKTTTANYDSVGDTISYTYDVVNSGNVRLAGPVTISDNKTTATCPNVNTVGNLDGFLDPGETITYTAVNYVVTQADLNAGSVTNIASASAGGTTSNTDTVTVNADQKPALTIAKEVDKTVVSAPGTLTYTITVTNTGNVDLTGVELTDLFAGGATLTSGDENDNDILETTETWVYTADYTVTQADINAGDDLVNVASVVTTQTPTPKEDDATTTITQTPSLTIAKDVDLTNVSAPGTLTYTITVTNTGNVDLTNVVLTDTFAGGATYVSGDLTNTGVLDTDEAWVYTADYTVTQADINAGDDLVNVASVVTTQTSTPKEDDATTTITQTPSLTIAKDVDLTNVSAPGTLTYTITVTNTGNVDLTNVVLTDTFAGGATYVSGDLTNTGVLDTDEAWVYTADYTVTQADINAGDDLVNVASVVTTQTSTPKEDDATTTITQTPSLTIAKDVDLTNVSAPGTLTYTITVTNTGNVDLTNVVLTDAFATATLFSGDTNINLIIETTETWIYHASHTVTQAEMDAGTTLRNVAVVDTDQTTPKQDDATTTITQNPLINIAKVGTLVTNVVPPVDRADAGDKINYTFTVTNVGNVTLTEVTVTDARCDAAPVRTSGDDGDNKLQLTEIWTYTCTHTLTQIDLDGAWNTSDLPALLPSQTTMQVSYPVNGGDAYFPTVTITNGGFLNGAYDGWCIDTDTTIGQGTPYTSYVFSSYEPIPAWVGLETPGNLDLINWVLNQGYVYKPSIDVLAPDAGNNGYGESLGNYTYSDVQVAIWTLIGDQVSPNGLNAWSQDRVNEIVAAAQGHNGYVPPSNGIAAIVMVPITSTGALSAQVIAAQAVLVELLGSGGQFRNVATADSTQSPPDDDEEIVPIPQNPALTLTKSASPATYNTVGQLITYTYVIKNVGNVTLSSPFTIADDKLGTFQCGTATSLAPGASIICTNSHTITQGDLDAGSITNHATATAKFGNTTVTTNEATTTVTAVQNPHIGLTKSTMTTSYDHVGQVINYTMVATNDGNVTLHDVSISDPRLGALTCAQPVTLAPGATLTCTGNYAITQADLDAGSVNNTATTTGLGPQGQPVSATASKTVPAMQNPHISLTKSTTTTSYDHVDQVINYTMVATNDGNVTLHDVSISDPKLGTLTCTPAQPTTLAPAATLTCTGSHTATQADLDAGKYDNMATATGKGPQDQPVSAMASKSVPAVQRPSVSINKVTVDGATEGDGRNILIGETVTWKYTVTNTGNVTLYTVTVTDNPVVNIDCDGGTTNTTTDHIIASLAPNASVTCTASGKALADQYNNTGSVTALPPASMPQTPVTASDPSSYFGANPQIDIVKKTVGADGTEGDNVFVLSGATVTWNYYVKNIGNVPLSNVTVTDSVVGVNPAYVSGDTNNNGKLDLTETWLFKATGTNTTPIGTWYNNTGTATGTYTDSAGHSRTATDSDTSAYYSQTPGMVTNSSLCDFGTNFTLVLTPDVKWYTSSTPAYKLSSSNPGQFFYNVFQTGGSGTVTMTLPYPFVTQGATPIHVYSGLTAVQSNGQTCLQPTNEIKNYQQIVTLGNYGTSPAYSAKTTVTLTGLPTSGFMYINIHLDYDLKKFNGWVKSGSNANYNLTINPTMPKVNIVNNTQHTFTSSIANSTDSIFNTNSFKTVKGFGGMVKVKTKIVDGVAVYEGLAGAKVELRDSTGKLLETMTTDVNGWYLSAYIPSGKSATFTVKLIANSGNVGGVVYVYTSASKSVTTGGANKFGEGAFDVIP